MDDETLLEETDDEKHAQAKRRTRIMVASGLSFLVVMMVVFGLKARSAPPGEAPAAAATTDNPAATVAAAPRAMAPAGSGDLREGTRFLSGTLATAP